MKKILLALIVLALISCKKEIKTSKTEEKATQNASKNIKKSRVVITLNGMDYHATVNCSQFNEDSFYFKSDKLDNEDTNGDDIVISGHQRNNKMELTLITNGNTYSSDNLKLQKKDFTAIGAGKLFLEGTSDTFNTTYKVTCN